MIYCWLMCCVVFWIISRICFSAFCSLKTRLSLAPNTQVQSIQRTAGEMKVAQQVWSPNKCSSKRCMKSKSQMGETMFHPTWRGVQHLTQRLKDQRWTGITELASSIPPCYRRDNWEIGAGQSLIVTVEVLSWKRKQQTFNSLEQQLLFFTLQK